MSPSGRAFGHLGKNVLGRTEWRPPRFNTGLFAGMKDIQIPQGASQASVRRVRISTLIRTFIIEMPRNPPMAIELRRRAEFDMSIWPAVY